MNSIINPARACFRSILFHRTHLRNFARSTTLLLSEDEKLEKALKQRRIATDMYEEDPVAASGKTTVRILNKEEDLGILFDSFSEMGFLLNNGYRVLGPCAVFSKSILQWNIAGVQDITPESLSLFTILEPKIDILVLGVGDRENLKKVDKKIISYLRSQRINVEMLPTEDALSTYNFLTSEARNVAGAFVPPSHVTYGETEKYLSEADEYKLAEADASKREAGDLRIPDITTGTQMVQEELVGKQKKEEEK